MKLSQKELKGLADLIRISSIAVEGGANTWEGCAETIADSFELHEKMRSLPKKEKINPSDALIEQMSIVIVKSLVKSHFDTSKRISDSAEYFKKFCVNAEDYAHLSNLHWTAGLLQGEGEALNFYLAPDERIPTPPHAV